MNFLNHLNLSQHATISSISFQLGLSHSSVDWPPKVYNSCLHDLLSHNGVTCLRIHISNVGGVSAVSCVSEPRAKTWPGLEPHSSTRGT
ncbi:hypothetical protein HZ326_11531 [Fusarium oxysporum f. sp. albedinis]|nr:hypothetical protein HZ326_11531 [Fusarium oxysporum f. sp. albedinis]